MSPPASATPSLTTPTDLFRQDNVLSDKLNDFQSRYSRFVRCQTDQGNVQDPSCNASDSFINVQRSYNSLLSTIEVMETSLDSQFQTGISTKDVSGKDIEIVQNYAALRLQRQQLDDKLRDLYSQNNGGPESSQERMKQTLFANTLWIILASCLIWYAVIEMK